MVNYEEIIYALNEALDNFLHSNRSSEEAQHATDEIDKVKTHILTTYGTPTYELLFNTIFSFEQTIYTMIETYPQGDHTNG